MMIILPLMIVFFAGFTQSVAGFGFAMVAMPLLHAVGVPLGIAAPLIALLGLTNRPILIFRYRADLKLEEIWRLSLSAVMMIPIGVWLQGRVSEDLVSGILGVIIITYALVSLWELHISPMNNHLWEWGLGLVSGLLGGAYNISGPTAVVYAVGRRWQPQQFKANLQTFALVISIFVTVSHLVADNYNAAILQNYFLMLPMMLLGIYLGFQLDSRIPPMLFRKGVLLLLIITGLRLLT